MLSLGVLCKMPSIFAQKKSTVLPSIPLLQQLCLDTVISNASGHVLEECLSCLELIYLPSSVVDYLVAEIAKLNKLTKPVLRLLSMQEIGTLDLSRVDFSCADEGLFDDIFEGRTPVKRMILDGVFLEACFYKMFANASRFTETSSLKKLEHLHLNNCESLTDIFVSYISEAFPLLKTLFVSSCSLLSPKAIVSIACSSFNQSLLCLDISYNWASAESLSFLSNLAAIESIEISNLRMNESFHFVMPSFKVQALGMSGLRYLEDNDITSMLGSQHPFESLEILTLAESALTSETLNSLIQHTVESLKLTNVDLSWCENLSEDSLASFISKCPNMVELHLQSTNSGAACFSKIGQCCPHLQVLNFARCKPEPLPLQSVLKLPHLRSINLAWAIFCAEDLESWVDDSKAELHNLEEV